MYQASWELQPDSNMFWTTKEMYWQIYISHALNHIHPFCQQGLRVPHGKLSQIEPIFKTSYKVGFEA